MTGPTVWTGRRSVRVDTDHLGIDVRDVVGAGDRHAGVDRGHTRSHSEGICSDVRDDARAKPDDSAVATSRKLHVLDLIAPMRRGEKTFATALAPGTRAASANRQQRAEDVLGLETEV